MTTQVTVLDNGIRIITDTLPGIVTAAVGIWVEAGARHEKPEINGISHFLEHMAFKGTKTRSAKDIAEEIENVGGFLNAYTTREQTAYHARVLGNDVPLAINLLSDILLNSVFDPDEMEKERHVILQEIGQANDTPDDIIFDYFQEQAFQNQAIGRSILGKEDIIRSLKSDDLRHYMVEQYQPHRIIVSAAGQVNHDEIVAQIKQHFSHLPKASDTKTDPAVYQGGSLFHQKDLEQVHLLVGFESVPHLDPDYYTAVLFSNLLGGGMSSRLFQEIREKRGLVYSIYSFNSPFRDTGIFGVYAGTSEEHLQEILPCIKDVLTTFTKEVDEIELSRSKAQLKAGIMMSRESTAGRCEQLANQLAIYGRPLTSEEMIHKIEPITLADIKRIADRILLSTPTFVALGPKEPPHWA